MASEHQSRHGRPQTILEIIKSTLRDEVHLLQELPIDVAQHCGNLPIGCMPFKIQFGVIPATEKRPDILVIASLSSTARGVPEISFWEGNNSLHVDWMRQCRLEYVMFRIAITEPLKPVKDLTPTAIRDVLLVSLCPVTRPRTRRQYSITSI